MAIYDGNGNLVQSTVVEVNNTSYDHWLNAPNLEGGVGYLANKKFDSSGNITGGNGYYVTGLIPLESYTKIRISDMSKVDIGNSKVYWFKSDHTYYSKKNLSEQMDEYGDIRSEKYNTGIYQCLMLKLSDSNIRVTVVYPEDKALLDNEWLHTWWSNTEYNKQDYTYSENDKYGHLIDNDPQFPSGHVRAPKPAFFHIPEGGNYESYKLLISEYPDMTSAKTYTFTVYREYYAISNLKINRTYWIKVYGVTTGSNDTLIAYYPFDTKGLVRQISLVSNMRDIGGHKTSKWGEIRQGRIYRCAKLDEASEGTRQALVNFGINAEIDLRLTSEIASGYESPFDSYYNHSIGSAQSLAQNVQVGIENYTIIFLKILEWLKAGKNMLYHCKGGADRTGIISGILEGVLGCSLHTIDLDYETTNNNTVGGTVRDDLTDDNHWWSEAMLALQEREGADDTEKWESVLLQGGATKQDIEDFRCIMLTDYMGSAPIDEEE